MYEPLDFVARLAALIPEPRVNLTRFHDAFAPNSKYRSRVTPAKRGQGSPPRACAEGEEKTSNECRILMSWAQPLKRVFNIDVEICQPTVAPSA